MLNTSGNTDLIKFWLRSMLMRLFKPVNVKGVTLSMAFSLRTRLLRLDKRLKAPSMLLKLFLAKLRYFKLGKDKSVAMLLMMLNPRSKYSRLDSAPAKVSWSTMAIWLPYMLRIFKLFKSLNVPLGISLMILYASESSSKPLTDLKIS